jgi:hypothetical protein
MLLESPGLGRLIPASMVLRRHENQPWAGFRGTLLQLRSPSASLQNADHRYISREHANSNGERYREAQNQGHEERNHNQPPLLLKSSN